MSEEKEEDTTVSIPGYQTFAVDTAAPAVVLVPGNGSLFICRDNEFGSGPDLSHMTPLQRALMAVRLRMLADRLEEEA